MRQQLGVLVAQLANLPAALAQPLDQEDVILIKMRADAAAVAGVADHDVVDPPIGDKAEWGDECGDFGNVVIDGLNKQGPRRFAKLAKACFRDRAMFGLPLCLCLGDQPRLNIVFACQPGEFIRINRIAPFAPWVSDQ
jgi:hypothetical protein